MSDNWDQDTGLVVRASGYLSQVFFCFGGVSVCLSVFHDTFLEDWGKGYQMSWTGPTDNDLI